MVKDANEQFQQRMLTQAQNFHHELLTQGADTYTLLPPESIKVEATADGVQIWFFESDPAGAKKKAKAAEKAAAKEEARRLKEEEEAAFAVMDAELEVVEAVEDEPQPDPEPEAVPMDEMPDDEGKFG